MTGRALLLVYRASAHNRPIGRGWCGRGVDGHRAGHLLVPLGHLLMLCRHPRMVLVVHLSHLPVYGMHLLMPFSLRPAMHLPMVSPHHALLPHAPVPGSTSRRVSSHHLPVHLLHRTGHRAQVPRQRIAHALVPRLKPLIAPFQRVGQRRPMHRRAMIVGLTRTPREQADDKETGEAEKR
jgi:hypothetical protein